MTGWARGALVLAGGLLMFGAGLHLYLRRELPRGWVVFFNTLPIYYRGNVYALIPYGLGVSLVGIGALIGRQPSLNVLVLAGMACCILGVALVFWHPNWIRPRSMRGASATERPAWPVCPPVLAETGAASLTAAGICDRRVDRP